MNKAKKAGTVVISVLLWVIILIAALYSITVLANKDGNNVASVAGFTPLVVQSDSMAPTFCKDDMIIIRKCDTQKLEEGDIITFHTVIDNKLALNTHRIVKIEEYENGYRSFTTRGDNNPADDTHILAEGDIVGKHVTTIPKLGKLMNFLSSSAGFLIVIVIPMFIFFVYQLYHLITVVLALKKATALEALEEQAKLQAQMQSQIQPAAPTAPAASAPAPVQTQTAVQTPAAQAQTAAPAHPSAPAAQAPAASAAKEASAADTRESLEAALAAALKAKEEAERALAEAKAQKTEKDN